ncbi:MAG: response regulator transcription factor [Actinomycetota bacterium]|nr:response regulator transcription factor [Actinomycetota bacterium]
MDSDRGQGPEDHLEISTHTPRRGEEDRYRIAAGQTSAVQGSLPKREATSPWVNWQSALYVLVLVASCLVLVPLTSLWWIVLVLGTVIPLALAVSERSDLRLGRPDDKKGKERELLEALAEQGEITPTTAAMRTSLTVVEASKMLDALAGKGYLKLQAEDGVMTYALRGRDRTPAPGKVSASPDLTSQNNTDSKRLEDPLSERELEVLALLASGRTNAEIAKDLFVAVGTVKSRVNNIYRKLDAGNRTEAVTQARELKLLR